MSQRKIGRIETFFAPPRWLFVRVESRGRRVRLGRGEPRGLGRGGRRRVRGLSRPLHRRRPVRHRGHLAGRLSRRLLPRRGGADVGAVGPRAGAVGPEGPGARAAGVADARRQGARQGPLLRLDRRRPAARDRRGRRRPQEPGLHRGQDERHRRARLDRHAQAVRRGGQARRGGAGAGHGRRARFPRPRPPAARQAAGQGARAARACCSSRSRCCPRTRRGCARSRR